MDLSKVTKELALNLNKIALEQLSAVPTTPVLLIESITIDEVISWIESKHTQIWGQFIVTNKQDKEKAANWFINSVYSFYGFRAGLGSQTF